MRYLFIIGFVVMVGAQWYVPLSMIVDSNKTIEEGVEYHFRTQPVDPSDPFRGKYITLDFNAAQYHIADTSQLHFLERSQVYATVGKDTAGFAQIVKLSIEPPDGDVDYIAVEYTYTYDSTAYLNFPFSRFYLEESKASEAERVYWQSRIDTSVTCYAKVRVWKGDAKVVDVMINDSSIVDVVNRVNKN
jgi:uncharacterized membrane-anchored protein